MAVKYSPSVCSTEPGRGKSHPRSILHQHQHHIVEVGLRQVRSELVEHDCKESFDLIDSKCVGRCVIGALINTGLGG